MSAVNVSTMSDGEVVAALRDLLGEERRLTAAVLVHLGEVEARRLSLPAACASMHGYCTRVLGMSDDQAYKRIRAARAISGETQEKLVRAQALLRHQVPSGDLAEVLDRALDALLDKVEARKFGKAKRPRAAKACRAKRTVPRAARREAVARDGMRCSFVSKDGRRCEETGFLELDHVVPVALGGEATVDGVRVLCRWHNQHEAERILGRDVALAGKAARAMDDDLVAGLRRVGVTASDARQAVAARRSRGPVEERMRAALAALARMYASRGRGARSQEPGGDAAGGSAALPAEAGP